MRIGFAIAAAVLALTACNQTPGASGGAGGSAPSAQASNPLDTMFPDLFQASYRAEANVTAPGHTEAKPIVMIRSGKKMRMEFGAGDAATVVISDLDANQSTIISHRGGRLMAMRMGLDTNTVKDAMAEWTAGRTPVPNGPCAGAGQIGTSWTLAPNQNDAHTRTSCVTHDGILLKATSDGTTTWETTKVERGAQDPSLFAPPPGVTVMDMGNLSGAMRSAVERMKAQHGG